jgi:hypothetical protein
MIAVLGSPSNADRDLTSLVGVLTITPDATYPRLVQVKIDLGDGAKDLDGTGGDFEVKVTIGGQTWNGGPQTKTVGTAVRTTIYTEPFAVPANAEVVVRVLSPNGADTDVDTTATMLALDVVDVIAVSSDQTAANNLELMFDGTGYAGGTTKLAVNTTQMNGVAVGVVSCTVSTANTTATTNLFATASLTSTQPNAYSGASVRFIGDDLDIQRAPVTGSSWDAGNSETILILGKPVSVAPGSGDAFALER